MGNTGFTINESFKTNLITGILSSPLLYIPHFHYSYIDQALREIIYPEDCEDNLLGLSKDSVYEVRSEMSGRIDFESKCEIEGGKSIEGVLSTIIEDSSKKKEDKEFDKEFIFIAKNSFTKLTESKCQRLLQTFAEKYERGEINKLTTIIFVSPESMENLPEQVEKIFTVVEVPRPSETEIREYIKNHLPISNQFLIQEEELVVDLTRALQGLQHYEIEQIIRSASVKTGNRLTENTILFSLEEKKNLVRKSGIIEVVDTDTSFDQIGGLKNLREDLVKKAKVFRHLKDITSIKLPLPKGVLILGMPGCGKSLIAKSIANEFGVSLLRLDINRLMGQYVGQSESNLRKALATAEAAHPCVLWIDEIEKAFAGANGGASGSNNDIVMRLMGHFLTWMQERKTAVYIVATANDVMRPEFMRKGRFDEVYFVDFPTLEERIEILKKKLEHYQQDTAQQDVFDFSAITESDISDIAKKMESKKKPENFSNGFSGSEIESVVNSTMENYFLSYIEKEPQERTKIEIKKEDFIKEIEIIKSSVMSNQESKKDEHGQPEKTAIERIRNLQETYKFRKA